MPATSKRVNNDFLPPKLENGCSTRNLSTLHSGTNEAAEVEISFPFLVRVGINALQRYVWIRIVDSRTGGK